MTVIEIVAEHLRANGFGGLVQPDAQCGCCLGDLQPCGEDFSSCKPAYQHTHADRPDEWLMSASKELAPDAILEGLDNL